MKILIDSREQNPFAFTEERYREVQTIQVSLYIGDYSLKGLEEKIAIERKSLPDLIACLSHERDRFQRELMRARGMEYFAVVIEAPYSAITTGRYRSKLNPFSACQSIAAFNLRYCPFLFCENRALAEYVTYSLFRQYLRDKKQDLESIKEVLK